MIEDDRNKRDPHCAYCKIGWRRWHGLHVPTQRHGMIPATSCRRIEAQRISHPDSTETVRPCVSLLYASVEGRRLLTTNGHVRRYLTEEAAMRAGRLASEDRE